MNELKKNQSRLKRESMELAAEVHDIVEEKLWDDYHRLPDLSTALVEKVREYEKARELFLKSESEA